MIALLLIAQLQPLPPQLIALDSDEGRKLLVESSASRDFYALVGTFTQQESQPWCGLAASVTVLNAMPIEAPVMAGMAPFRGFTQENVFTGEARAAASRGGLTVDMLAGLLRAQGVEALETLASVSSLEAFRAQAVKNLGTANDYLLVDFLRSELGQDTGAHWSPVAAYHAGSDRFLILDVNRARYQPYWARAEDLFRAMNTTDLDSGKSRGWISVAPLPGGRGRAPLPELKHRIVPLAIGAVTLIFLLGALAGALAARKWRATPPAR